MKIKREVVAIMSETGKYLESYKNRGTLAYVSDFTHDIKEAAVVPIEFYELQKEKYEYMAKMFDAQLVKIQVEYEVTTLDGEKIEIVETHEKYFQKAMAHFLKVKHGGQD